MPPIIRAEGLGKLYHIGSLRPRYGSLRESVASWVRHPIRSFSGRIRENGSTFWALKDVNFDVSSGEVVGIIGRNGAGKSTLLKVLSRITEPTEGRAFLRGRVASLLEVGTGFHPELTGRDNIFLNGAILGMGRAEVARKFDEIVAFAEVERFIDTPVKHYSSGMYVRLAFSVAAHLEPEILVVDEVLAVGDASFQKKCLGRMREVGRDGRTVLFVSHNLAAVRALCSRAILLQAGTLVEDDEPVRVIERYTSAMSNSVMAREWPDFSLAPRNDAVVIRSVAVCDPLGSPVKTLSVDDAFSVVIDLDVVNPSATVGLALIIYDKDNNCVLYSLNNHEPHWYGRPMAIGRYRSVCSVPPCFFNHGWFNVSLSLFGRNFSDPRWTHEVLRLELLDAPTVRGDYHQGFEGVVRPLFRWETRECPAERLVVARAPRTESAD